MSYNYSSFNVRSILHFYFERQILRKIMTSIERTQNDKNSKKSQDWPIIPDFLKRLKSRMIFINFLRHWKVFFEILPIDSSLLTVLSDFYVSVITVFNQINYFRGTSELFPSLTDLQNPFWLNFKRNSLCII